MKSIIFELKTTNGSDNQRKPNQLTKYPLLACAPMHKLAGHFLLNLDASTNAFSRRSPLLLACVMSSPAPKSSPVQSSALCSPMWLLHSFTIWIATPSNPNLTSAIIRVVLTKLQNSLHIPYRPYRICQVLQFALEFCSHFLPTARNLPNS